MNITRPHCEELESRLTPSSALAPALTHQWVLDNYGEFLDRSPTAAEARYWLDAYAAGTNGFPPIDDEQAQAVFLGSSEYSAIHPSNTDWVRAVYVDVLGRETESMGEQFWTELLDSGTSRLDAALLFMDAQERSEVFVTEEFQFFLRRDPLPFEQSFYTASKLGGATDVQVRQVILDSPEAQILGHDWGEIDESFLGTHLPLPQDLAIVAPPSDVFFYDSVFARDVNTGRLTLLEKEVEIEIEASFGIIGTEYQFGPAWHTVAPNGVHLLSAHVYTANEALAGYYRWWSFDGITWASGQRLVSEELFWRHGMEVVNDGQGGTWIYLRNLPDSRSYPIAYGFLPNLASWEECTMPPPGPDGISTCTDWKKMGV